MTQSTADEGQGRSDALYWRNSAKSYGHVSIVFHWIMAGLFFAQFWIGLTMESEPSAVAKAQMLRLHLSLGFVILALWLVRLAWRLMMPNPVLPAAMGKSERRAARISHAALYLLLGATPLVGWAIVSTAQSPLPMPIPVFGLVAVPLLPLTTSAYATGLWTVLHAFMAYFLLALAAVHALAAIRHQFTLKDGLLRRMIVPGSRLKAD